MKMMTMMMMMMMTTTTTMTTMTMTTMTTMTTTTMISEERLKQMIKLHLKMSLRHSPRYLEETKIIDKEKYSVGQ